MRATVVGVGDGDGVGVGDDVQNHTTPAAARHAHYHGYTTPPGSPVSMRTTFCKYLDRSSRLLPLLNPPFALGPYSAWPKCQSNEPQLQASYPQSPLARAATTLSFRLVPQRAKEKLYYCVLPATRSVSHIYLSHHLDNPLPSVVHTCSVVLPSKCCLFTNSGRLCPLRTLPGGSFRSSSSGQGNCWDWFSTGSHTARKSPVSTSPS